MWESKYQWDPGVGEREGFGLEMIEIHCIHVQLSKNRF